MMSGAKASTVVRSQRGAISTTEKSLPLKRWIAGTRTTFGSRCGAFSNSGQTTNT